MCFTFDLLWFHLSVNIYLFLSNDNFFNNIFMLLASKYENFFSGCKWFLVQCFCQSVSRWSSYLFKMFRCILSLPQSPVYSGCQRILNPCLNFFWSFLISSIEGVPCDPDRMRFWVCILVKCKDPNGILSEYCLTYVSSRTYHLHVTTVFQCENLIYRVVGKLLLIFNVLTFWHLSVEFKERLHWHCLCFNTAKNDDKNPLCSENKDRVMRNLSDKKNSFYLSMNLKCIVDYTLI